MHRNSTYVIDEKPSYFNVRSTLGTHRSRRNINSEKGEVAGAKEHTSAPTKARVLLEVGVCKSLLLYF